MSAPFLDRPKPELSFGDLCRGELFFDAYLRADASHLRADVAGEGFVKKRFGLEGSLIYFLPVVPGVPALALQEGRDYVLAHGERHDEAVCLSDDCVIETLLGRDGGAPSGRLVFAPATRLRPEQTETLTRRNWRRMRLGESRVIELHRAFSVATEDVAAASDDGRLDRSSLDDGSLQELAERWSAHACRRGPLAATGNAEKLGDLLVATETSDEQTARRVAQTLAIATAAAWRLEGRSLERAGQEYDDNRDTPGRADPHAAVHRLGEDLDLLETAVRDAKAALTMLAA